MRHYFSHNSCYDAGVILRSPEEISKVPQDFKAAFDYFTKGCALGNSRSCYELSSAYHFGRGTEKNQQLAKEYRKRAQDLDKPAE